MPYAEYRFQWPTAVSVGHWKPLIRTLSVKLFRLE